MLATTGLAATPLLNLPEKITSGALIFMLALLGAVSAALIFSSQQKNEGTDIGEKAYPATIAAYILWAVMAVNWFG
mgnify:CR=1 FL=1|jgi:hypothetical protein